MYTYTRVQPALCARNGPWWGSPLGPSLGPWKGHLGLWRGRSLGPLRGPFLPSLGPGGAFPLCPGGGPPLGPRPWLLWGPLQYIRKLRFNVQAVAF